MIFCSYKHMTPWHGVDHKMCEQSWNTLSRPLVVQCSKSWVRVARFQCYVHSSMKVHGPYKSASFISTFLRNRGTLALRGKLHIMNKMMRHVLMNHRVMVIHPYDIMALNGEAICVNKSIKSSQHKMSWARSWRHTSPKESKYTTNWATPIWRLQPHSMTRPSNYSTRNVMISQKQVRHAQLSFLSIISTNTPHTCHHCQWNHQSRGWVLLRDLLCCCPTCSQQQCRPSPHLHARWSIKHRLFHDEKSLYRMCIQLWNIDCSIPLVASAKANLWLAGCSTNEWAVSVTSSILAKKRAGL